MKHLQYLLNIRTHLRIINTSPLPGLPESQREQNTFYFTFVILVPKLDKSITRKVNYRYTHAHTKTSNFKTFKVTKTVWYWQKDTHADEWKRTQSISEINFNFIFDKGTKRSQQGKNSLFITQDNCISTCQKTNLKPPNVIYKN